MGRLDQGRVIPCLGVNEAEIVYRALHDILGDYSGEDGKEDGVLGNRFKVKVTILEIYNEEIYDLLATNPSSGINVGWSKNTGCRVFHSSPNLWFGTLFFSFFLK